MKLAILQNYRKRFLLSFPRRRESSSCEFSWTPAGVYPPQEGGSDGQEGSLRDAKIFYSIKLAASAASG